MKIPFAHIETFIADADSDNTRPMKSAWLDVEGSRLLATNGHIAIRLNVECDPDDISGPVPIEAFELARKELKAIQKTKGKETIPDPWLKVVCNLDEVFIQNLLTSTTHMVNRQILNEKEKFPTLDSAFPRLTEKPTVTISATYLAAVAKSLETDALSLWVLADDKAVVIASATGPSVAAVMPMKTQCDPLEVGRRGTAKGKPKPKGEATVSMGIVNPETGKTEYTQPLPLDEFTKRLDDIGKDKLQ